MLSSEAVVAKTAGRFNQGASKEGHFFCGWEPLLHPSPELWADIDQWPLQSDPSIWEVMFVNNIAAISRQK